MFKHYSFVHEFAEAFVADNLVGQPADTDNFKNGANGEQGVGFGGMRDFAERTDVANGEAKSNEDNGVFCFHDAKYAGKICRLQC